MIKYLGKEFKNHEELRAWVKAGKVAEYKRLMKMFYNTSDVEYATAISVKSSDVETVLIKQFGMSATEIENLEIEALKEIA